MTTTHPRSIRTMLAAFALLAFLAGSAACSSDSDTASDTSADSADTSMADGNADADADTDADAGDADSDATTELPDGFPDIPLPEYTSLEVQQNGNEDGVWSVNFAVVGLGEKSDAELADAYKAQLEDAGYEVTEKEQAANAYEADNRDIDFSFYVGADEFLIQII